MNKSQAKDLIKETFNQAFDKERYRRFMGELLNRVDWSKETLIAGHMVRAAFKDRVSHYERVGTYSDPAGKKIDLLIIYVKREKSLERGRTYLRNFVADYLLSDRGMDKAAVLAAFVPPSRSDWRFSFIKLEHEAYQDKEGQVKSREILTPARRYSFLVGEHESSHTAQTSLVPLLEKDTTDPSLEKLENAFGIESVTTEFFRQYKRLFEETEKALKQCIEDDEKIREDFREKNVNPADFSKKLLGQIVFLYFLQKKGWFGVARDGNWGDGPKDFLRRLFKKEVAEYSNFFNDILEPLFYETLALQREADYSDRFHCKIPFLNGGLFDPINDYDWVHTDILLPNDLFSNEMETREGDKGTGILDVFDRYNFTVKEDEPLEREVAVDPEMLGKVFEELLEKKERKSKGSYYTPREIVHYMCRESLIHYLDSAVNIREVPMAEVKTKQEKLFGGDEPEQLSLQTQAYQPIVPKEDIETLIRKGEFLLETESTALQKKKEYENGTLKGKSRDYRQKLPDSIRQNAALLDEKIRDIKVCDPAIGSGAFPVGMLQEIVKARRVLNVYLRPGSLNEEEVFDFRETYAFKRHAIQNSLYGVDIDPAAVEIAKLRLWLSLVVDEEEFKIIKPLPNLDYKVVCGDALIGVEHDLWFVKQLNELEDLKKCLFDETNIGKKEEEKKKIEGLIQQITHNDRHFHYEVHFSEIFHGPFNSPFDKGGQGGFDVVIANPPYVRQEKIRKIKPKLKKEFGAFFCGTADLYTYFYKKGLDILNGSGHLCFIAPNKFMRAGYGKNTRGLLVKEAQPKIVIDFGDLPIFDATTYPSILLLAKGSSGNEHKTLVATFTDPSQLERMEETLDKIGFPMPVSSLKPEGWNLERPEIHALMEKLRAKGAPLEKYVGGRFYRGVLTGLNEAFVIDAATRERLIAEDPKSEELIKPWLRGRDIKKWKAEWVGLYVIFTRRGVEIEKYPAIKRYLEQFRADLEPKKSDKDKRGRKPGPYKWFEIQDNIAYYEEFERPKITWGNLATEPKFALDSTNSYVSAPANIIPVDDLYLLAALNTPLCMWFIALQAAVRSGGFLEFKPMYVDQLPIFPATAAQKIPIIERAQAILSNPDSPDVPRLEAEIDQLVYGLYGLTEEEIGIVERMR